MGAGAGPAEKRDSLKKMEYNKSRGSARFFPSKRNRGRPPEQLEVMRMGVVSVEKLAIHGGPPVRTKPWVSKYMGSEALGAEEKARVLQVLEKKRIFRYPVSYTHLPSGKKGPSSRLA